jgi:fungal STAND N-terminal Goodbye domain
MSDTSGCRLQVLFDAALESYEKQTGMKLNDHPLAKHLENCHSVDSILDVLQQQARAFMKFQGDNGKVKESLKRVVHVLHALSTSTTLGEGVGLVCQMAFSGISNF